MSRSANIRIARNTIVIYIRMAVTILVGLVTSRLVLQALGASDVGIYSAVGSTVALIAFITGALTATTVRFMNFEMGKAGGDTNRMFNICHVIHIGGALVLFLLLESIGLWYIHNYLNVPPGKETDAMFVFQVSTVVACLGIANVPFQSLFTVHERFGTVALVTLIFGGKGFGHGEWMMYNLLSGSLLFGAFFMATDYATSPVTMKGQLLFGAGCGLLTVLIRYFGGFPEGTTYAILIMNLCTWAIDKAFRRHPFGVTKGDLMLKKAQAVIAKEEKR